jgi:hypothetical protein
METVYFLCDVDCESLREEAKLSCRAGSHMVYAVDSVNQETFENLAKISNAGLQKVSAYTALNFVASSVYPR